MYRPLIWLVTSVSPSPHATPPSDAHAEQHSVADGGEGGGEDKGGEGEDAGGGEGEDEAEAVKAPKCKKLKSQDECKANKKTCEWKKDKCRDKPSKK